MELGIREASATWMKVDPALKHLLSDAWIKNIITINIFKPE